MTGRKIVRSFYTREEVTLIAKELLGKILCTNIDGKLCRAMIVETEAYSGKNDKASHASNEKRTERTRVFYEEGGRSYVYLCYGMHHLFNIITNRKDKADAVLIRAVQPLEGIETMMERRGFLKLNPRISSGPGSVSRAMGIDKTHYGEDLEGDVIWLEEPDVKLNRKDIVCDKRIGIDYAGEDALKPWRFYIRGNKYVSKPNLN